MGKTPLSVRIGISGWRYVPWRGTFYPQGLGQKQELAFASRQLNSIEINGTFYSLQRPSSFREWHDSTPEDFVFSLKGGRFITHMKRLKEVGVPLATFFASGVLLLKRKLGPILWQFPPNFQLDLARFEAFFELLPRDTTAASELANAHRPKMKGGSWTRSDEKRPMRYAVEIRHDSFRDERFVELLRRYNIALVIADTAGLWPEMEDITADFIYARLHGAEEIYASGYTEQALDGWAKRFATWASGREPADAKRVAPRGQKPKKRDLYIYFDNDKKVRAPFDAMGLMKRLSEKC